MKELILILVKKNVCWHCAVFVIFFTNVLAAKNGSENENMPERSG